MVVANEPFRPTLIDATVSTSPATVVPSLMNTASAGDSPGQIVPLSTLTVPVTVPLPPSVPPETASGLAILPVTDSFPPAIVVAP